MADPLGGPPGRRTPERYGVQKSGSRRARNLYTMERMTGKFAPPPVGSPQAPIVLSLGRYRLFTQGFQLNCNIGDPKPATEKLPLSLPWGAMDCLHKDSN